MAASQAPLDLDALLARIRQEAASLDPSLEDRGGTSPVPAPAGVPRLWQEPGPRTRYKLAELLCFQDDEQFLDHAYRALLGRAPDPDGARPYEEYLRHWGSRLVVLYEILHSEEGRGRGVRVDGIRWLGLYQAMRGKRLVLPLLLRAERSYLRRYPQLLIRSEIAGLRRQVDQTNDCREGLLDTRIDELRTRLAGIERHTEELRGRAESHQNQLAGLGARIDALQGSGEGLQRQLDQLSARLRESHEAANPTARDRDEVEWRRRLVKDIDFIRSDLIYHRTRVRAILEQLRAPDGSLAPADGGAAERPGPRKEAAAGLDDDGRLDGYYFAFEEEFRGPQEKIRATQADYLADIRAAGAGGNADPVLDLGCGRGEWLALLAEEGLAARGVDTSAAMVARCRAHGLEVERGDALGLLAGLADGALGALTAFHLIEHLPFARLHDLIEQAHRALRPGGVLILETPNPENLLVGSHTFYHDPTHRNPMTPAATRFLVRYLGFADPEIRRLHPYPQEARVPGSDPLTERVNGHLCGPQDFALVARKPSAPG